MKQLLHKTKRLSALLTLAALLALPGMGWASTLTEGFNSTGWGSSYGNYTVNNWSLTNVFRETTNKYEGAAAIRFNTSGSLKSIVSPLKSGGIGTISLWHRRWSSSDGNVTYSLFKSTNGIDWGTAVTTFTSTNDTYSEFTYIINDTEAKYVKIESASTQKRALIDLISITDFSISTPLIELSVSELSNFNYILNSGPSSEQTFTVSGSDLTADISIAASTNYEISKTSGSGYTTPLTFTQTSGTVDETTVYVRLKAGLAAGNYNSEVITASSTDASDKTVTCSGSVSAPPPPDAPTATAATSVSSSGFTANWDAEGGATGYELDVYTENLGSNASDLFISEYIDGSSGTNKAVEIFNGTGTPVDLSNYRIWLISNGGNWPETTINLTGTLANNDVFVITNGTDYTNLTNSSDLTSVSLSFNGNDAVGLAKNISGTWTLIDAIGIDGADPGTGWDVAGITNATADRVLTRKSSVSAPNTNWDASRGTTTENSEWIVAAGGTNTAASGFGAHSFAGGSSQVFVDGYEDLDVEDVTSYEVTGLDASTTYYYVVRAYNDYGASASSDEIEVTTTAISGYPSISNPTYTSVGSTTVTLGGEISSDGGSAITERGTVWSTTSPVTIADNKLAEGGTSVAVFSHARTGLPSGTLVYFRAYATNANGTTLTDESSFTTFEAEPSAHASGFLADVATPAYSAIDVVWDDATAEPVPDGYVVKASTTSYAAITTPVDGTPETPGTLVKVVNAGTEVASFTGLESDTQYFFKIWPFTNSGAAIDYKTDGAVPETTATTDEELIDPPYRSKSSGSWTTVSIWEVFDGVDWIDAYIAPAGNNDVTIKDGHTVEVPSSGTRECWDLTIENGAKLWANNTSMNTPRYLTVFGNITCNGTLGNGSGNDDVISFNMNGQDQTISGTGTFTANRMRKNAGNVLLLHILKFAMDVELRYNGDALYNTTGFL